jgi:hypothetical protein
LLTSDRSIFQNRFFEPGESGEDSFSKTTTAVLPVVFVLGWCQTGRYYLSSTAGYSEITDEKEKNFVMKKYVTSLPNLQSIDQKEMNMFSRRNVVLLLLAGLVLTFTACAPQSSGIPVTGGTSTSPVPGTTPVLPPKVVLDAQQWLATQLNMATDQVTIIDMEQAEWTDSCLGLGRLDESCLQAITPGWKITFEVNGQRYEVRTDETGSTIRMVSPDGTQSVETPGS